MTTRKIAVGLRLPQEIKEAAEQLAQNDRRSFSSYIEWLIAQDAGRRGYLVARPDIKKGRPEGRPSD